MTTTVEAGVLPIKYFLAYYGTSPWRDLVLRWNGKGTAWKLFQVGVPDPIYAGPALEYAFAGEPNTQYFFRLETTVDAVVASMEIMTFTTSLTAPSGLKATSVSDTAAMLAWNAQAGVDRYDVCDVTDSYRVLKTVTEAKATVSGLASSSRQSVAVRSHLGGNASMWSAPLTFFTKAPDNVEPGAYEFPARAIYTWTAGRPGSSDPGWRPAQDDWFHGDGLSWNDASGQQTTYFFYGSPSPFGVLRDSVVTKCEVFVARSPAGGDPGEVLSRLGLHAYAVKPDGEPSAPVATADAGPLTRGQELWIEVPADWGQQLIRGAFALGVAWGGTPERYMIARNTDFSASPRTGTIRITVG